MPEALPDPINRRPSRSENVSFADPVVLHESSAKRVVMIPFYIKHTDHTELAVKIATYRKSNHPLSWEMIQEKSISMKEAQARKLLTALKAHLQVAAESDDGEFIVIRLTEGRAQLNEHDPLQVASALGKALSQPGIVEHLQNLELGDQLVTALRGAIRLSEMRSAISQLRLLLDSEEQNEAVYQKWCETHTWAFGNAYVMRDDVRDITTGDKLDMLLPTVISGYREIVELKRPNMNVLLYDEAHSNYYFSSEVSKAIGQVHRYIDVLHKVAADGLDDHPEIIAYHPRAIIVIGRSSGWKREMAKALHGLNHRLSGVVVMTFDQLLAQGERLIELLGEELATDAELEDINSVVTEVDGDEDQFPERY